MTAFYLTIQIINRREEYKVENKFSYLWVAFCILHINFYIHIFYIYMLYATGKFGFGQTNLS